MDKLIKRLLRESLSEVHQPELSSDEQLILDDLISMNEALDFGTLIQKFSKYAKKGAITAGVVLSLLSNDALGQEQKQQVLDVAKTSLSSEDIKTIQSKIKSELGLEFNSDFIKDRFSTTNTSSAPALPSGKELMSVISNNGVPGKYLDNVYVDYITDAQGNETSGVKISVRLKEEGEFKRLRSTKNKNLIFQRVVDALKKKEFKDAKGDDLTITLEVKDPDGGIINNSAVKI